MWVIQAFVDRAKADVPYVQRAVLDTAECIGCAAAKVAFTEARGGIA